MSDSEHLQWIYDRLQYVHGENKNYDYMHKLREVISSVSELQARLDKAYEFKYQPGDVVWCYENGHLIHLPISSITIYGSFFVYNVHNTNSTTTTMSESCLHPTQAEAQAECDKKQKEQPNEQ